MSAARKATRIALAIGLLAPVQVQAQDWDPFKDKDERAQQQKAARPSPRRAGPAAIDGAAGSGPAGNFTPGEVTRGSLPPLSANAAAIQNGEPQAAPAGDASPFSSNL